MEARGDNTITTTRNSDELVVCLTDTPFEEYKIQGRTVYVKREDLCCPDGPPFSKMRGLFLHLQKQEAQRIGVLDTIHSKAGWAAAYVCKLLGKRCINFFPEYEEHVPLRGPQLNSKIQGAELYPLKRGRSAILWYRARKLLKEIDRNAYLLPNGLQLEESIEETKRVVELTPTSLLGGSWVVSASTGTIAKGVYDGLFDWKYLSIPTAELIVHLGYSRSIKKMQEKMPLSHIIDEGYAYKDKIDYPCPFPCNPYYDLKAWKWLNEHIEKLADPIVFYNIGS